MGEEEPVLVYPEAEGVGKQEPVLFLFLVLVFLALLVEAEGKGEWLPTFEAEALVLNPYSNKK